MEIELKLAMTPENVPRLFQHPLLQEVMRRELLPQELLSVYYDTPDLDLKKKRIALRLRRCGERWIQTVKTEGRVVGGLHERPEWESDTTEDTLDFAAIADPALQEFFADENLRQRLHPVFVTEFSRAVAVLEFADGSVVEFALDQGEIRAGDRRLPLCEVELELKAGNPARLFAFALDLQETIPFRLENISKAERGYNLIVPPTLVPVKAFAYEFTEQESVNSAFLGIVQAELVHLQANEEGAQISEEPEFVHQMRVALRRMRSAISVFSALMAQEHSESIRTELRWLTAELDAARNWDVFILQTLPPIFTAFPTQDGLTALQTRSVELRQHAHQQVRAAIASPRYQRFLLTLAAWLCMQPWREDSPEQREDPGNEAIVSFATHVLQKRHKQVKKRGKHLLACSPQERHEIRIAAKKLRYAAEFFSSLYRRKRTHRYVAALAELQDILGTLNDTATTMALMEDIPITEDGEALQQAKSLVRGWAGGTNQTLERELERVWNNFATQKVFW